MKEDLREVVSVVRSNYPDYFDLPPTHYFMPETGEVVSVSEFMTETTEMSDKTEAPQWAIVELMGHVCYGGLVSKDNQFGTAMLRLDVPQKDGSFVSQLVNPSSIYRVTICSEELARAAAARGEHKPLQAWQVKHLLPKSAEFEPGNLDEDVPV